MSKHVVFVTWKTGNAPAFEAAKRLGHQVTLIRSLRMERSQNVNFDQTPYREFVDQVHILEDATEYAALRQCVIDIHRNKRIDGFIATVDALVVPVAWVAAELGIPFTSRHGAENAKQKHRCRDILAAACVDATAHALITGIGEAHAFALAHGYPFVLKPACASASEGAFVIADPGHLRAVFGQVERDPRTYQAGILVEEYLRGTFVSAEIGLSHDRVLRLAVSERKTWDKHEALEIGTTIPAAISAADYESVMTFAERVIRTLDLRLGVFHVEIMLGPDGRPRLIELNPRIMGSCLPNLFFLAGGGDVFELLVRIYLNEEIDISDISFTGYATVRWFGAARQENKPTGPPELGWAGEYGPALRSLSVRYPNAEVLRPCRGNLGHFGEVQVVHEEYGSSVRMAEEIVERVARQLGMEVTR
jgi:biotin carboxylase